MTFPATALVIYLVGLLLAFGWRSFAQWRRTGDTGLRLAAGPAGSVGWWAKLSFVAALLLGLAGPLAALVGMPPVPALDQPWLRVAGAAVAVLGALATLAAQLAMGTSWRVGVDPTERTTLVTGGVFALARNPVFTTMVVTSAGLAAMVPNPVSLMATATLVASVQIQVRLVEEPYLLATHGDSYAAYAARVGRFLPRLGRRPRGTPVTAG